RRGGGGRADRSARGGRRAPPVPGRLGDSRRLSEPPGGQRSGPYRSELWPQSQSAGRGQAALRPGQSLPLRHPLADAADGEAPAIRWQLIAREHDTLRRNVADHERGSSMLQAKAIESSDKNGFYHALS